MKTSAFTAGSSQLCSGRSQYPVFVLLSTTCNWSGDGANGASPWLVAQQLARDYDALDVRGALLDLLELGVPHPLLHGVFTRVAPAAERLDGGPGAPHRRLRGMQLRHR